MLTRWNDFGFGDLEHPFFALNDLRREMDRLFADFEQGWGLAEPRLAPRAVGRMPWPRVSLQDAGAELKLRAEVPGMSEKDLDVTVEQSTLTLRGERKAEAPEGYAVHRQERAPLSFARSFTLPCRIAADKVSATLKNGVLELTLPKVAEEQPRQIQVRVA